MDRSKFKNYLTIELSFLCSVLLCALIIFLLSFNKESLDIEYIITNFIPSISNFLSEKTEFYQYVISFITFILSFTLFKIVFDKLFKKTKSNVISIVFYILNSLILISLIVIMYILFENHYCIYYYLYSYFMVKKFWCYFITAYLTLMIIVYELLYDKISFKIKSILNMLFYAIIILFVAYISTVFIQNDFSFSGNALHHVNAYIHPIIKLYNGLIPLIDFNSLYGFYPYVYVLIMKLFNVSSLYSISILLAVTCFLTYLFMSLFASKIIRNKLVLFLVISMSIYFSLMISLSYNGGIYPQYLPGRMICPCLMLFYGYLYIKNKNKVGYWCFGFVISSFSLFYNFETGLVCLGSYMSLLGYELLYNNKIISKDFLKGLIKIIIGGICSFVLYVLMVELVTLICGGTLVSIKTVLMGVNTFFGTGFFMLKMPLKHPWILLALIYCIAFSLSLSKIKDLSVKEEKSFEKYSLIFFLAVFGVLVFSYYQGRSHMAVFCAVVYPGIILLGSFIEILMDTFNKNKNLYIRIVTMICSLFICIVLCFFGLSTLYLLIDDRVIQNNYNKNIVNTYSSQSSLHEEIDTYNSILPDLEFLIPNEIYWYNRYNKKDTKKINDYGDIFSYKDFEEFIKYLKNNDNNIITSEKNLDILIKKYPEELNELLNKYHIYHNFDYAIFLTKEYDEIIGKFDMKVYK